jgi:riboflavin kinase/FMN adenylyltransferase
VGDFDAAARLLGRPFSVFGTVVEGDGRGRELGFPTANLDLHHEIEPPEGVYVAHAVVADEVRPALVSVGRQPTFAPVAGKSRRASVVEIHLIDFSGELYGTDVEARFLARLRGQRRYERVKDLVAQMASDLAAARAYFDAQKS